MIYSVAISKIDPFRRDLKTAVGCLVGGCLVHVEGGYFFISFFRFLEVIGCICLKEYRTCFARLS